MWKENMSEVAHFNTAEDFWRYFSHIPSPSQVFFDGECHKKVGGKKIEEFSLFKKGIEPEWGDPLNAVGGGWYCRQYFDGDVLDLYWQNLVFALVGETLEDAVSGGSSDTTAKNNTDVVNGIRVLDKSRNFPMFKLEVWLSTCDDTIKEKVKEQLLSIVTDGLESKSKTLPKFEWKDHS
jgi:translation initiation factor 4E